MKKGFAIIGTGVVASIHAQAINHIEKAVLLGVFSLDITSRNKFADEFNCREYQSMNEIAEDDNIDYVCICTPSGAHLEPALLMADNGKNIIIEKPLEITPDRCDRIIESAKKNNVQLSCIFQTRFHPSFVKLKKAMDSQQFGTISLASAYVKWFRDQDYYRNSNWRGTWKLDGGGALMNQSIHVVDLLLWLMGNVENVKAFGATISHKGIEVEDTLTGIIKFQSGALGSIEATTGAWPGSFKKIEICGDKGHAIIEEDRITTWKFSDLNNNEETNASSIDGGGVNDPIDIGYEAHMKQILDCINSNETASKPQVTGKAGKEAVELISRLYKSAGLR